MKRILVQVNFRRVVPIYDNVDFSSKRKIKEWEWDAKEDINRVLKKKRQRVFGIFLRPKIRKLFVLSWVELEDDNKVEEK